MDTLSRGEAATVGEVRGGDKESGQERHEDLAGDVRDRGGCSRGLRPGGLRAAWLAGQA